MRYIIMIFIFLAFPAGEVLFSQNDPCSSSESSQFDFWIGEWSLEWQNGNNEAVTGTNTITKTLGGCAIEENFSTSDKSFMGRSFSVYNPNKQYWQQTWVDNSGGYLDFTGSFSDGKMILSRKFKNKQGKEVMQRMVFYDIQQNELWWNWENSTDDGKTWNVAWKIHYRRK